LIGHIRPDPPLLAVHGRHTISEFRRDYLAGLGEYFAGRFVHHILTKDPARQALRLVRANPGHSAVRRLDKAILVDLRESRQPANQADVGTFWRFDWADASIVRIVNVAHIKACTVALETARAERRQRALVREFIERIGLLHELRQLASAKELSQDSNHWPHVD